MVINCHRYSVRRQLQKYIWVRSISLNFNWVIVTVTLIKLGNE